MIDGGLSQRAIPPKETACRRIRARAGLFFLTLYALPQNSLRGKEAGLLFAGVWSRLCVIFGKGSESTDVEKISTHVDDLFTRVEKTSTCVDLGVFCSLFRLTRITTH
jgi:hypothetical protein